MGINNFDMKNNYDKRHLPFGHSAAISDTASLAVINNYSISTETLYDQAINEQFLSKYVDWILTTTNNKIAGIEQYPFKCFSQGTSEAFEKCYMNYSHRRFRCFKGEYVYHKLAWRDNKFNWKYLEDDVLESNDVVIISQPFSDTGNQHPLLDDILNQCDKLDVPVIIDCCYFGICSNVNFDFTRPCIKEITFSLSKTFPVSHIRIGMRLSRLDNDDLLFVYNKSGYTNRLAASIGLKFINQFSPDYIFEKYRDRQLQYCDILDVEPSNCVLFGIGDDRWHDYNRDRATNRLSFHKFLADDCTSIIKNEKR
jgi:hypothetical protein